MNTAKIFMNGMSQAVRLPKDFRFDEKEIYIKKIGNIVMLIPKKDIWKTAWEALDMFSDDFMDTRNQPEIEEREKF